LIDRWLSDDRSPPAMFFCVAVWRRRPTGRATPCHAAVATKGKTGDVEIGTSVKGRTRLPAAGVRPGGAGNPTLKTYPLLIAQKCTALIDQPATRS
jgi:hypothetical protein